MQNIIENSLKFKQDQLFMVANCEDVDKVLLNLSFGLLHNLY